MGKDLHIGLRGKADSWVNEKPKERKEPGVKVTVDLPVELHQKLKILCVMERVNIADKVRSWIEEKLNERSAG